MYMNTAAATALAHLNAVVAQLPVVTALDMLHAQGYVPTETERAAIDAVLAAVAELGADRRVSLKVVDFHGHTIGSLSIR